MKIEIRTIDELNSLFGKAYWIESQMELTSQWEAYIIARKEEIRNILFKISHDSESHRIFLKRMASKIEGLEIEKAAKAVKLDKFDFKRFTDEEILTELLRNEYLMLDIYQKIHSFSGKDFIKEVWKGESPTEYFSNLKWLIGQESSHIALLRPFAGRIERVK